MDFSLRTFNTRGQFLVIKNRIKLKGQTIRKSTIKKYKGYYKINLF